MKYEEWLLNEYPDEIKSKEDLIKKSWRGWRYEEFKAEVNRRNSKKEKD